MSFVVGSSTFALYIITAVGIDGASTCPTPTAVAQQLAEMGVTETRAYVSIATVDDQLQLKLRDAEGRIVAERMLPAEGGCEERAQTAAVVLATWLAQWQEPEQSALTIEATPHTRSATTSLWAHVSWDLAAGGGLVYAHTLRFVIGTELALSAKPQFVDVHRLGVLFDMRWTTPQSMSLGTGRIRYQRLSLGVGPFIEPWNTALKMGFFAEGLFALALVQGAGFTEDSHDRSFDFGLGCGVRSVWRDLIWARLEGRVWARRLEVRVDTLDAYQVLPRAEVLLSVGLLWSDL